MGSIEPSTARTEPSMTSSMAPFEPSMARLNPSASWLTTSLALDSPRDLTFRSRVLGCLDDRRVLDRRSRRHGCHPGLPLLLLPRPEWDSLACLGSGLFGAHASALHQLPCRGQLSAAGWLDPPSSSLSLAFAGPMVMASRDSIARRAIRRGTTTPSAFRGIISGAWLRFRWPGRPGRGRVRCPVPRCAGP